VRERSDMPAGGVRVGEVRFIPLSVEETIRPEDGSGRTAGSFFVDLIDDRGIELSDKDILVLSSKVVALLDGAQVRLDDVRPSRKARILGRVFNKDPRKVQLIIETGGVLFVVPMKWIIRIPSVRRMMERRSANPAAMLAGFEGTNNYEFVVSAHAAYLDDAGIDYCNLPEGFVSLLPPDPCATAARIRSEIMERFGKDIAVIITDTVASVGRVGSQDVAIGYAGIDPVTRVTFSDDLFGIPRSGGVDILVDSIAGMAGLVMGQTTEKTPAVLVRGVEYLPEPEDEEGMAALAYPPGAQWRMAVYMIVATVWFRLVNLITFQRWPRRSV